jgi:hypothetical protein
VEGESLNAYKFLRAGAVGPFSGRHWSPGEWVEGEGLSACERQHLPLWIWEELWEIELDGEVVRRAHKLRATRARLGRRVDAWSPSTAASFACFCASRAALHASGPLHEAGFDDAGAVFADGRDLEQVQSLTEALWEELAPAVRRPVGMASDGAASALSAARGDDPYAVAKSSAEGSYISAMTAAAVHGGAAYQSERDDQAEWLAAELGLSS